MVTTSKTTQLVNIIGRSIVKGDFKAGDVFESENALCKEYQVSRGVIRELLQRLSEKGLIEKRMHSSWRVCSKEEWNIFDDDLIDWCFRDHQNHDLYLQFLEFRKQIEPNATELATVRATPADIENLQRAMDLMLRSTDNQDEFVKADSYFHQCLFKATHNNVFAKIGKSISKLLNYSVTKTYRKNKEDMNVTISSHHKLLEAIINKDPMRAGELNLKIIFRAMELLEKEMEKEVKKAEDLQAAQDPALRE